jgi:hypothetical protein
MTYTTARAQLVTLLEAVTLTTRPLGMRGTLKNFADGDTDKLPGFRGFFIQAGEDGDAGIVGPYVPDMSGQPLLQTPITVVVVYPGEDTVNAQTLDQVIEEDRAAIAKALLTEANWNSATSKIEWLSDNPLFAPSRREPVDGATLLVFRFNLVHR